MTNADGSSPPPPVVKQPDDLEWVEMASGVRMVVLLGDPAQAGPFAVRLMYPGGFRKDPHTHPNDAYVTVHSGSYYRGYGTTFDQSQGIELVAGTFSVNPAGVPHYEWADEPAEIQVHATGPWGTILVDVAGDPIEMPAAEAAELTM